MKHRFPIDETRRQYILDNLDLCRFVAYKASVNGVLPIMLDVQDLQQMAAEELVHCAQRYMPGRAKFRSYAQHCMEKKLFSRIQEGRFFGPSSSTLWRWHKEGILRPQDVLSFEEMDDDHSFIETVASPEDQEFIHRLDPQQAQDVLQDLARVEGIKLNSRNKAGAVGVIYWADKRAGREGKYGGWRAYLNVLGERFWIGKYSTKDEAVTARGNFISELREFCEGVVSRGSP